LTNEADRQGALRTARRGLIAGGVGLMLAGQGAASLASAAPQARAFDFLLGSWSVAHRRLKARLARSRAWDEFPGTLDVRPILHGLGNVDQNVLEAPAGRYLATSLRVFDVGSGQWSIYWIDGRGDGIDKPVVGRFDGLTGRFYSRDEFDGRPIMVRFTYRDLGPGRAGWDQAFSTDEGRTWEVNWTMDFARSGGAP
jgi:hypothetical protein